MPSDPGAPPASREPLRETTAHLGYTSRPIIFTKPFLLPGMPTPHAPGTFELRETREALEPPLGMDLSFPWTAYRTTTMVMIPAQGALEAWAVTGDELKGILGES